MSGNPTVSRSLRASGIVGAGGAGFPTHLKYRRHTQRLIINVQDSEPGYVKDKWLMLTLQEFLNQGLELLQDTFRFDEIVFAVKDSYKAEFAAFESKFPIVFTDDTYWNGEAKKLASTVFGIPFITNQRTQDFDVTVSCLETVANLCWWLLDGLPVTDKYVQVYGAVKTPRLVRAPVGTSAKVLLALACPTPDEHFVAPLVLTGGPMMGRVVDPGTFTVLKTTNDLFVAPVNFFERHRATTPTWRETPEQITKKLRLGSILDWHPKDVDLIDLTEGVDMVKIDLRQAGRFGKASRPIVCVEQPVARGELIAIAEDDEGVDLHASISGFVHTVMSDRIVLAKERSFAQSSTA